MQGGFAIDYIYAVICGGPSFARMDKAEPYPLRGRIWMYDAANVCGCTRVGAGKGRGADPDGGGYSRHLSGDGVLQVFSQTRAAPAPVSGGIVSETTIPGGGRSAPCANGGQPRGGSGRGKGTQCIARLVCCCWRCRLSGRSHLRGKIWAEDGLNSAKAASRRWSTTSRSCSPAVCGTAEAWRRRWPWGPRASPWGPGSSSAMTTPTGIRPRSEERRVGKECRSGSWAD